MDDHSELVVLGAVMSLVLGLLALVLMFLGVVYVAEHLSIGWTK